MPLKHRLSLYRRRLKRLFTKLPQRALLTLRYQGPRETARRIVTFPLRLTPLAARLGLAPRLGDPSASARAWYRGHGRPVAVIIPTFGEAKVAAAAVKSVLKTTARDRVRILITDDGSAPEEVAALQRIEGVELLLAEQTLGFAGNVNRALAATRPDEDVVLLNSDVVAHPGWLEVLQHAAHEAAGPDVGITGGKLLYPDETIQFGGTIRNPESPQWFDHRFRFRPADFPPSDVMQLSLAVTGACLYITRETLGAIGPMEPAYGMAFEDVDWCLRAWQAGKRVVYAPAATLTHHESKTRGLRQGEREQASLQHFWNTWGDFFDRRSVEAEDGGLRIVYVTQDTGVGGGHRVVYEHLNGLLDRGHHPELWTLAPHPPDWFDLRVPTRSFADYPALTRALAPLDAIKVATWWETAAPVWEASVRRGIPVYHVQDIETSYYPDDPHVHAHVLASYRPEFRFIAGCEWIRDQLLKQGIRSTILTPGVDLEQYRPLGHERDPATILGIGRSNPLKNFALTRSAYLALPEPRPRLELFGIEPQLAEDLAATYHLKPSDEEVNRLFNTTTVFLQTSRHEGFCMPPLEAMAAGLPVVCTDAHGNRDFCIDGVNCLMPPPKADRIAGALRRLLDDPGLRDRLVAGGRETAKAFRWEAKLQQSDAFFRAVAAERSGVPV